MCKQGLHHGGAFQFLTLLEHTIVRQVGVIVNLAMRPVVFLFGFFSADPDFFGRSA